MTAHVPPTPPVPPPTTGGGAASGIGTLLQAPATPDGSQLQLQLQQAIRGIVLARTAQGTVTLRTPLGPVSVQTGLTPPPGAPLTLVVQSLGPPIQVSLQPGTAPAPTTQTGGQAGTGAAATQGAPTLSAATGTAAAPAAVQTTLTQGSVVFATLTRPAGDPGPVRGAGAAAVAATPRSGAATAAPAGAGGPVTPQALAALPAGSRVAMRLVSVQIPGTAPSAPAMATPPASAGTVQAAVTGAAGAGQTQVQSPIGQMTLATSAPLPQGAQLRLEPVGQPQLPVFADPVEEAAGLRWDTLRDSIQAVTKAGAGPGQVRMMQAVPQPTPQMPAAVLFFLQALRHGSMRGWIGDSAAETLGRQNKGLLDRLGAEFGQMQRLSGEPVAPDWRLFLIPLFADGEAERLKLYVKDRQAGRDQDGDPEDAERFVIEANFTRLGPFQFDGLARPKRLDLMIRTLARLPKDMQDGIGVLFADTASALGLTGSLTFQVTDRFEAPPGTAGGSTSDAQDGVWV